MEDSIGEKMTKSQVQNEISTATADMVTTNNIDSALASSDTVNEMGAVLGTVKAAFKTDDDGNITSSIKQANVAGLSEKMAELATVKAAFKTDDNGNIVSTIDQANVAGLSEKMEALQTITDALKLDDAENGYAAVKTKALSAVTSTELNNKFNSLDFDVIDEKLKFSTDGENWSEIAPISELGGSTGADGKSAYQIWLDKGYTGDEQDFLDSLKGDNGQDACEIGLEKSAETAEGFTLTAVKKCKDQADVTVWTKEVKNGADGTPGQDACEVGLEKSAETDEGFTLTAVKKCKDQADVTVWTKEVKNGADGTPGQDACEVGLEKSAETDEGFTLTAVKKCKDQADETVWTKEVKNGTDGTNGQNPVFKTINNTIRWKLENESEAVYEAEGHNLGSTSVDSQTIENAVVTKLEEMNLDADEIAAVNSAVLDENTGLASKLQASDFGDAFDTAFNTKNLDNVYQAKLSNEQLTKINNAMTNLPDISLSDLDTELQTKINSAMTELPDISLSDLDTELQTKIDSAMTDLPSDVIRSGDSFNSAFNTAFNTKNLDNVYQSKLSNEQLTKINNAMTELPDISLSDLDQSIQDKLGYIDDKGEFTGTIANSSLPSCRTSTYNYASGAPSVTSTTLPSSFNNPNNYTTASTARGFVLETITDPCDDTFTSTVRKIDDACGATYPVTVKPKQGTPVYYTIHECLHQTATATSASLIPTTPYYWVEEVSGNSSVAYQINQAAATAGDAASAAQNATAAAASVAQAVNGVDCTGVEGACTARVGLLAQFNAVVEAFEQAGILSGSCSGTQCSYQAQQATPGGGEADM